MNKMFMGIRTFKTFRCLNVFSRQYSLWKCDQVMHASNCFRPRCGRPGVLHTGSRASNFGQSFLCRSYTFGPLKNFRVKYITFKGHVTYQNIKTSPRMDIHPYIWVVIRPLFKFIAVLTGRGFRKWWRDLPPNKRKYFWGVLKKNRVRISVISGIIGCLGFVYYESHLQETPITNRKRFIVFTEDQCREIADFELKLHVDRLKKDILPKYHPAYSRVTEVGQRLLGANKDIKEIFNKNWTITVVESPEENAFAFPNGSIFVFTGMLNICSNNDQLACVIAHELAHCILGHAGEQVSFAQFVDYVVVVVLTAIWAILPSDLVAVFAHWMFSKLVKVLVNLPYQRNLEVEADEVGMQLAAKACFDVRESSAFWAKMAIISKHIETEPEVEFLSTHPSHEKRSTHLDSLMKEALELRTSCGCPSLKTRDPRLDVVVLSKVAEDLRRKNFQKLTVLRAAPTVQTEVPFS